MKHDIAVMTGAVVVILALVSRVEAKEVSPALSAGAAAEWNVVAGQWKFGDGILEQENPEGPIGPLAGVASAILKDPAFTDFKMTADFNIRSEGNGERSALMIFRATGTLSYYGLYMDSLGPKNGNAILARSTFKNRWIEIARRPCPIGPDAWHTAQVECRGAKIAVTIDKTPVLSVEDKSLPSGRVGLGTSYGRVAFRNLKIEGDVPAQSEPLKVEHICRIELVGETIQITAPPRYCAFLDMVYLRGGDLLLVYNEGNGHLDGDLTIDIRNSKDNGKTWGKVRYAVPSINSGCGVRDPHIIQLADGTLLLNYFVYPKGQPYPREQSSIQTKVARSTDQGQTWSDTVTADASPLAWAATSGKIFTLDDGTLLMPVYGLSKENWEKYAGTKGETFNEAGIVRSADKGKTWSGYVSVVAPQASGVGGANEMDLARLPDGTLVAILRPGYRSASKDNGKTWSPAEKTVPGYVHSPGLLADGPLLLMNHRCNDAVRLSLSTDGGKTFPDYVVFTEKYIDCAYGAIVKVPNSDPGLYFTAYYCRAEKGGKMHHSAKIVGQFFKIR